MSDSSHPYVQPKSPLEIQGIYLALTRERFNTDDPSFAWQWSADNSKTRIFIEAGAGDDNEVKDGRPAIYVDRDSIVAPRIVIGDRKSYELKSGASEHYTVATGRMSLDCISSTRAESSLVAEVVHSHLMMAGDILLSLFRFRDFTPLTMGRTQPWEKDAQLFHTRVTSEFSYDVRWKTIPIASRISSIGLVVKTAHTKEEFERAEEEGIQSFPPFSALVLKSLERD